MLHMRENWSQADKIAGINKMAETKVLNIREDNVAINEATTEAEVADERQANLQTSQRTSNMVHHQSRG